MLSNPVQQTLVIGGLWVVLMGGVWVIVNPTTTGADWWCAPQCQPVKPPDGIPPPTSGPDGSSGPNVDPSVSVPTVSPPTFPSTTTAPGTSSSPMGDAPRTPGHSTPIMSTPGPTGSVDISSDRPMSVATGVTEPSSVPGAGGDHDPDPLPSTPSNGKDDEQKRKKTAKEADAVGTPVPNVCTPAP
jgi:hypothetical protein